MELILTIIFWLLLNIFIGLTMQFALYTQVTKDYISQPYWVRLLVTEYWASIEWMAVIPSQRIGYLFLNPAQLAMSSYIFDFLSQLWANKYWLEIPTTYDDYIGMILILFGMYVTTYRVIG